MWPSNFYLKPRTNWLSLHNHWYWCRFIHTSSIHYSTWLLPLWLHIFRDQVNRRHIGHHKSRESILVLVWDKFVASWTDLNRDNHCYLKIYLCCRGDSCSWIGHIRLNFPEPVYRFWVCDTYDLVLDRSTFRHLHQLRYHFHLRPLHSSAKLLCYDY